LIITSTRNDKVLRARSLSNKKGRLETGLHFIEGDKFVREAIISGAEIVDAFIEEGHDLMQAILEGAGAEVKIVSRDVMKALANTNEPQYVCATVKTPELEVPRFYDDGLIVVLDEVQDPGNLGTIIRTADAFGAQGVLISDDSADPFAPKPLRASMGSVYHIPIWRTELAPEIQKLTEQGFTLVCGHLKGSEEAPAITSKMALIIGNESRGVSDSLADISYKYRLPIYGFAESLNASVAAGILIYKFANLMRGEKA